MKSEAVRHSSLLFQPFVVLLFSLTVAALYGLYMLRSTGFKFSAFSFSGPFFYVVPIVVPFVAFLFDRAEHFRKSAYAKSITDVFVVGTAMGRLVTNVPFISGHTLFLTYSLFTSRSRVVKISAALVMLQTVYLKYFVWHDWVTSTSGIVVGSLAAYVVNHFERRKKEQTNG